MALKHAVSILMSRFSLTYKTLLYAFLVILIFVLIGVVVLVPFTTDLVTQIGETGLFAHIQAGLRFILTGQFYNKAEIADTDIVPTPENDPHGVRSFSDMHDVYVAVTDDIVEIGEMLSTSKPSIILSFLWIILVIMLFKIVMTMCHYPIADVVNNFMAYNSRFGFTSNFVSNLGISAKYSLSEFIVSLPYYLITFGAVFGIGYAISLWSNIVAIMVSFAAIVVIIAIKRALLAFWLPHLIYTKGKVWKCFKEQFKFAKEKFVKVFGLYVMTNLLMVAFVAFFGILTFGIGFFVGYALCVVLSRIIDMVIYYRHMDHKYYIEPKRVIDAKSEII